MIGLWFLLVNATRLFLPKAVILVLGIRQRYHHRHANTIQAQVECTYDDIKSDKKYEKIIMVAFVRLLK